MDLVPGVATTILFDRVEHAVFSIIAGKQEFNIVQRYTHMYHTIHFNADRTINVVLPSVFSTVTDDNAYTVSVMI